MGARESKEKVEMSEILGNLFKEAEKKEANRANRTRDLNSDQIDINDPKSQIKTLCYQPKAGKLQRMQSFETTSFKADPIRELDDQRIKKFPQELRTRIENSSSFPYSVHGLLRIDPGNGNYKSATGILIGPDLVLTAAHNIYDCRGTKQKYPKIEFIPGLNEQEIPFGIFQVIETYVPDEFLKTWEQEDYALLVLSGPAGEFAGYFGLHIAEKEFLKGKELTIIGYPGQVRNKIANELCILSGEGSHQMWGMKGKSIHFEEGNNEEFLINYEDILTTPGQSGSGVFYQVENTNEYYVIGVHVLGREGEGAYNSATWITKKRFNQIERWVTRSQRKLSIQQIAFEEYVEGWQIKNWNLSKRKLGDIGVEALSEYAIPRIETIDLSRNNISDKGAKILTQKTNWPYLATLNLYWNNIGEEGATSLSKNTS